MTNLNLSGNSIGADGAKAIAEALKVNPVLNNLDLGFNDIGKPQYDSGGVTLTLTLTPNPNPRDWNANGEHFFPFL